MSTATAEVPTKVVPTELAELDFQIVCNVDVCDHAADWWLVCLACSAHAPLCEPHRRAEVLFVESAAGPLLVVCHECQEGVPARLWRRQFAHVPIGGTP